MRFFTKVGSLFYRFAKGLACVASIFILVGGGLNTLVVWTNHGFMPVVTAPCDHYPGAIIDERHVCGAASQHLLFLADWIKLETGIFSVGDAVLDLGECIAITAGFMLLLCVFFFFTWQVFIFVRFQYEQH